MIEIREDKDKGREELLSDVFDTYSGPFRFLEIGHDAAHIRWLLRQYFESGENTYIAVDIIEQPPPHLDSGPITEYIQKDSVEFWRELSIDTFYDVIFVDGCHCEAHVDLDVKGALLHLEIGGTLLMHDTGTADGMTPPRRAYFRNCDGRPEFECRLNDYFEGMGIVVKRKVCGKEFLVETEDKNLKFNDGLYGKEIEVPSVQEAFPLYFRE